MTVVGDVAQTTTAAGARSWPAMLDPVLRSSWRLAELTVNYRTPAAVADVAQRVGRAAGLPVTNLTSARTVRDAFVVDAVEPGALADAAVRHVRAALELAPDGTGGGRVAVIGASAELAAVREALLAAGLGDVIGGADSLDVPLSLLTPRDSKGLEFDVVVLVEPAAVLAAGAGDLYVAMTRPTRQLRVLHAGGLPAGFLAAAT